jgi:hypothetical protein
VDLEDAVEAAGDDGRAREGRAAVDDDGTEVARRLLDRHRVEDLEVADVGGVLVDRSDRDRVRAGEDVDDVRSGVGVCLLDRSTQRAGALARPAAVAADAGVDAVGRVVNDEGEGRRRHRAREEETGRKYETGRHRAVDRAPSNAAPVGRRDFRARSSNGCRRSHAGTVSPLDFRQMRTR